MPRENDPLCPLGFHPQVRWPTRCKRCFREYGAHKAASPSKRFSSDDERSSTANGLASSSSQEELTSTTATISRPPSSTPAVIVTQPETEDPVPTTTKDDSTLPNKPKKKTAKKKSSGTKDKEGKPRLKITEVQEVRPPPFLEDDSDNQDACSPDVAFIIQVKSSRAAASQGGEDETEAGDDCTTTLAGTETTETTLKALSRTDESSAIQEERIGNLKRELERAQARVTTLEREKADMVHRAQRNKTPADVATEILSLRKRLHELQTSNEELRDENRDLNHQVKEMQRNQNLGDKKQLEELRGKLHAAEQLCEELMEENEDMKKEIRDMEGMIEETKDNFREDQVDEFLSLKRELEQTAKNCRILQFKLKKAEQRSEELEDEKKNLEQDLKQIETTTVAKKSGKLQRSATETELAVAREVSDRMQKELEELRQQLRSSQEDQALLRRRMSGDVSADTSHLVNKHKEISATTLIGDETSKLVRELHDSLEREADTREQLKFAEEESESLRKKLSRVEEENEVLAVQIKKMTARYKVERQRSREGSQPPDNAEPEGPSAEELRVQLECNEQETSLLRQKVETLESEREKMRKEIQQLTEQVKKLHAKPGTPPQPGLTVGASVWMEKARQLESENLVLRKKLNETELENERLESQLKRKGGAKRALSLQEGEEDGAPINLDLQRKLQTMENEANIIRSRNHEMEQEIDRLIEENKKMQLKKVNSVVSNRKNSSSSVMDESSKIKELEEQLQEYRDREAKRTEELLEEIKQKSSKKLDLTATKPELRRRIEELEGQLDSLTTLCQDPTGRKGSIGASWAPGASMKGSSVSNEALEKERLLHQETIRKLKELQTLRHKDENLVKQAEERAREKEKEVEKIKEKLIGVETTHRNCNGNIKELQMLLKEQEAKVYAQEKRQAEVTLGWIKERDDLKRQIKEEFEKGKASFTKEKSDLQEQIKKLEVGKKKAEAEAKSARQEIKHIKEDMEELQSKLEKIEKTKNQEMHARMKEEQEKVQRLSEELKKRGNEVEKWKEMAHKRQNNPEMEKKLKGLENELTLKSREFEDLKKKHEALEEDYVVIKSQLQCGERGDRSHLEDELKRVRETFTQRQDNWIKEKLEMQSKIRELEDHMQLNTGTRADVVRRRLQERVEHLERKLKEAEVIEQMYERLKEEYDDIRTRLRDYESYSSAQKILNTPHSDAFEREIRDLRARLSDSEKAHKAEIAHMKLKASSKEAQHNAELSTLRQEIVKAGRERDTLKNLLEGTQRHMSSLKATTADVNEEEKQLQECYATIAENEERIQSLEDQISEARMESVRTKTDLATQKAGWELRMAQLQTRINELEEEKILSSGRSRLSGLRSKLELAWQKEREDQQRLLKEITESNKELRDAMNQLEADREEARRQLKELHQCVHQNQKETRNRVEEVQEDLKHVRESYSKLRLINDKLKRDKEKQEKEREDSTQILQNGLTKIHNEIRSIFQTPELKRQDGLQNECLRILEALEDLKRDAEPKPKPSRVIQHYRRTQSVIEERDEEAASPPHSPRYTARPTSNTLQPPMTKRSISFEDDEMRQLSSGGEKGSNSSLDHARYTAARGSREGSYDRVSVKSENIPGVVDSGRKSSGGMAAALKKKLSKLTKSKSIEDDLVVNPPDSKKGSISSSDLDITDDGDARGNRRESSGSVGGVAESKGGFFSRLRLRTPSPSQLLSRGRESRSPSVNRKRTETPSPERTMGTSQSSGASKIRGRFSRRSTSKERQASFEDETSEAEMYRGRIGNQPLTLRIERR